jgi:hypothetical protein
MHQASQQVIFARRQLNFLAPNRDDAADQINTQIAAAEDRHAHDDRKAKQPNLNPAVRGHVRTTPGGSGIHKIPRRCTAPASTETASLRFAAAKSTIKAREGQAVGEYEPE